MHCVWPCLGEVDLDRHLPAKDQRSEWNTVSIPLGEFEKAGMDLAISSSPFLINTDQPLKIRLGMIRLLP
jgi:beta-glucosidase